MRPVREASPTPPDMTRSDPPPRTRARDATPDDPAARPALAEDRELADLLTSDPPLPADWFGPPLSKAELAETRRQLAAGWRWKWRNGVPVDWVPPDWDDGDDG